jgi:hypothetical protein
MLLDQLMAPASDVKNVILGTPAGGKRVTFSHTGATTKPEPIDLEVVTVGDVHPGGTSHQQYPLEKKVQITNTTGKISINDIPNYSLHITGQETGTTAYEVISRLMAAKIVPGSDGAPSEPTLKRNDSARSV